MAAEAPKPPMVQIDADFTSQSLNELVLVSTALSAKDLSRKDLADWITQNAIEVRQRKKAVLLGSFRKYPQAWFYVRVVNTSRKSRQLVVDEFNRIRCDDFELISFKDGSAKNWGRIRRSTPFSGYPLPFFTYAIPITIPPKDTLDLLIHSQRHYGVHEVNLGISSYERYLSEHATHFLIKVFQIIVFVLCALIMLILGKLFRYKAMTYLGVYILSVIYILLNGLGFTDPISNFQHIGLSGSTLTTFGFFVSCVAVHPFLIEWTKVIPKNERVFRLISYGMAAFNLLCALCYFLPVALFNALHVYVSLPFIMLILSGGTVLWMLYWAIVAFFRARIYYMLIGFGIAFVPWIVQQLSSLSGASLYVLTQGDHLTFILAPVGVSVISVYLLREQLITRKKLEENLAQERKSLEAIRRSEIAAIGRDLHDNVGNLLASAVGYLQLKTPQITTSNELITGAMNEIRFLSHNLVKDDNAPLHIKLDLLVSRFNDFSAVNFTFGDYSEGKINQLDAIMQQNIYMITQELLTNIIKHAKATEASIQVFWREEGMLQFIIEDDGIGFLARGESTGIGLKNAFKRAEISQLKLSIDSSPQGTNFIIETPQIK
jgi:signal transduction histidine kinase